MGAKNLGLNPTSATAFLPSLSTQQASPGKWTPQCFQESSRDPCSLDLLLRWEDRE